jgi:HK97 family phage portal protein
VVNSKPNDWQTSFEFRENLMFQVGLLGNFYAFKNRLSGPNGKLAEIIPFEPGVCVPTRDSKGVFNYTVTGNDGTPKPFPASTIWHVRGPSWDTWRGLEAVRLAREAFGLAIATEDAHAKLHANGAQTSGLYSVDGTLGVDQHENMSKWIKEKTTGGNRFLPFVLDHSAKWTQMAMTGVDSQHLETRKFQIEEVCRACGVYPQKIFHTDKTSTYASAEQFNISHVVDTLGPWYSRIEQSANINLLSDAELKDGLYFKFFPNALMRGDSKTRAEFYSKLYNIGSLNPNEIRGLEDHPPYVGGDEYRVPLNMVDPANEPTSKDGDNE